MALIGSIVAFLSSSTAKNIGKFLYDRIEAFINSNVKTLPDKEIDALKAKKDEIKTINESIQNNQNETATETDLCKLKQKIKEIEEFQRKKKLPEVIISPGLFDDWIENEPIEDKALVTYKRLNNIIDWCIENNIRETKRWEVDRISNNLAMFTTNLRNARRRLIGDEKNAFYLQQVNDAEGGIRANLSLAKPVFVEYKKYGC